MYPLHVNFEGPRQLFGDQEISNAQISKSLEIIFKLWCLSKKKSELAFSCVIPIVTCTYKYATQGNNLFRDRLRYELTWTLVNFNLSLLQFWHTC